MYSDCASLILATPNTVTTGYVVTGIGANANLVFQTSGTTSRPTLFFTINSSGQWVTTSGFIMAVASSTSASQVVRPYTSTTLNASPATYPLEFCSIAADNSFQCTASSSSFMWSSFAIIGTSVILDVTTATANTDLITIVQLGVLPVDQCF
jgi:hypothetical protein